MSVAVISFGVFAASQVGTPGPANMMMMATTANYGLRQGVIVWAGTAVGFIGVYIMTASGLLGLLKTVPALWTGLQIACFGYILYLAIKIATAIPGAKQLDKAPSFFNGIWVHPLNPKAYAMQIAGLAQFASPETYALDATLLLIIFILWGGVLNNLWGMFGAILGRITHHAPWMVWLNRGLALLMVTSTGASLFLS